MPEQDPSNHDTQEVLKLEDVVSKFDCHKEERSTQIAQGADFDFCPFCGEELPDDYMIK